MPRAATASIDEIVRNAVSPVVERASRAIARSIAQMVATQLETELRRKQAAPERVPRARWRVQVTRWVADRRARRVPTFVIEATGLDTKKKIVAKYGENAAFEKGKPLPPVAQKSNSSKPEVQARPPIVRKKGKAAA